MANKKNRGGLKESIRKMFVSLKRKPQTIPLLVLAAAFLMYSLNLTHVSDSTAKIQLAGMGLSGFCTMLFSLLSFVCFLNAFPHRKKTNLPMLILLMLMLVILVVCDTYYMGCINRAITRAESPIVINDNTAYIPKAYDMLMIHRVIVAAGAALTLLVPVLRKLLRRIDTSLPVEEGTSMGEIHLSE